MTVKLPKPDHYPVVGGRVEYPYSCAYVIGMASSRKPVQIGYCRNYQRRFKELQRAQPAEIKLHNIYWVPDLALAKRLVVAVRTALRDRQDAGWLDVTAPAASRELRAASQRSHIPLLTNQEYRRLCKPAARIRRETELAEADKLLRRLDTYMGNRLIEQGDRES
jgi:T5orf172 domain-containing protein